LFFEYFLFEAMAINDKKRPRPTPSLSQRSKKRQRTDHAPPGAQKIQVNLDGLAWNEVQLPHMFEDADGFFGLEEIEGVDVVRDGNTVKFVCLMGSLDLVGKMLIPLAICYSGNTERRW
jgi:hypothetical protein